MHRLLTWCLICLGAYHTSFAAHLRHLTVADSMQGTREIVYEKKAGYAVVEGDILLHKLPPANGLQAIFIMKLGGDRWLHDLIPYEIDRTLPLENKLAVLEAIETWQTKTNLKFIELTNKNREQYPDYVVFTSSPDSTCSSFVGRQGGAQPIKLSLKCKTMNIAHEIGHAAGLWHEQSRGDRDEYVQIKWENIEEAYRYNFNQHITDGLDYGEYDYHSIMHYTDHAFSRNGEKTIVPLQADIRIGQREQLSRKDIAAINAMYPIN